MNEIRTREEYQHPESHNLLIAAFFMIHDELMRVMWNINQQEYDSPFINTSNKFVSSVFEVHAYSWVDENQEFNFKWRDFRASWYKHFRRGLGVNRQIKPDEIEIMLNECVQYLDILDEENLKRDIENDR